MPSNKTIYTLTVQTKTALHVGTVAGANDVSDGLFRRNAKGQLVLPGTSIAGAIRSHLTRLAPAMTHLAPRHICDALSGTEKQDKHNKPLACGCIVCHMMGDIRPLNEIRTTDEKDEVLPEDPTQRLAVLERLNGRASRLIVHDAILDPTKTYIRDGVGIDRTSGAAARAASAKFDFETIPAETPIDITLELEDADEIDKYLLNLVFYEWMEGRLRFGGNKSRGAGVLALTKVQRTPFELNTQVGLMAFLRRNSNTSHSIYTIQSPNRDYHGSYSSFRGSVQSWITIDFELEAQGFFLTNDTTQATAEGYDHKSLPFLPGSSLRGAIRSQAERIARTLVNLRVENEADFLNQCPAPNPFVTRADKQNGIESSAARIRQYASEMRTDAGSYDLSEQLFGSVDWGSRLAVEDAPIINNAVWKKLDFVAIDRFTGGAADGAKFDAYALWQPRFRCRLHLESPQDWEIGWLLYVLKDMMEGRVPVGFGAAKGFGDVRLKALALTLGYAYPEAVRSDSVHLPDIPEDGKTFFLEKSFNSWDEIVHTDWLKAWNTELNRFTVKVEHGKSHDPYWSDPIQTLYRKETTIHELLK